MQTPRSHSASQAAWVVPTELNGEKARNPATGEIPDSTYSARYSAAFESAVAEECASEGHCRARLDARTGFNEALPSGEK